MDVLKKNFLLILVIGFIYMNIETIWTAILSFDISLKGHTSLWMWPVGGFMGWMLGQFNNGNKIFQKMNMFWQSLVGMIFIFCVEFVSGTVLNKGFKLDIWSYTDFLNIKNQITLLFIPVWFSICPLAFWIDDLLRYLFYRDFYTCPHILDYYKNFWNPLKRSV